MPIHFYLNLDGQYRSVDRLFFSNLIDAYSCHLTIENNVYLSAPDTLYFIGFDLESNKIDLGAIIFDSDIYHNPDFMEFSYE